MRHPAAALIEIIQVNDDEIGKRWRREILAQKEVWKTQEYFVYFKFSELNSWVKRSAGSRRRFDQRLP
ncbi:MAG: hypothetical protein IJ357_07705 [Oscillospiraceae bacterium]|nr:hypothetical protein [Oscillospiraceae bacterium]